MRGAVVVGNSDDLVGLASRYPDLLLELRVDMDPDLLSQAGRYRERTILTLRSKDEGGHHSGDRAPLLRQMLGIRPRYIDLELSTDMHLLDTCTSEGVDVILSRHDYSSDMLSCAEEFYTALVKLGIEQYSVLFKFVGNSVDTIDAVEAHRYLSSRLGRTTVLSISRNGDVLRVLHDLFDQEIVYGSTTPGFLVPIEVVTTPPELRIGLLGKKLGHSLSPVIHGIFMRLLGIHGYYFLLEASSEDRVIELLEMIKDFQGINVTFPYKGLAANYCDEKSEVVISTRSCNTLLFGKTVRGDNTDLIGIRRSILSLGLPSGRALVYGAGDSARSVTAVLHEMGWEVTVAYRSSHRLASFNGVETVPMGDIDSSVGFSLFVNATPIGLDGSIPPVHIDPSTKVFDLVYTKNGTPLVSTYGGIDGKLMLFYQALAAFEMFSGREVDPDRAYMEFKRWLNEGS